VTFIIVKYTLIQCPLGVLTVYHLPIPLYFFTTENLGQLNFHFLFEPFYS